MGLPDTARHVIIHILHTGFLSCTALHDVARIICRAHVIIHISDPRLSYVAAHDVARTICRAHVIIHISDPRLSYMASHDVASINFLALLGGGFAGVIPGFMVAVKDDRADIFKVGRCMLTPG